MLSPIIACMAAAALGAGEPPAPTARVVSLAEAVAIAKANQPTLRQAQAAVAAAEARVSIARSPLLPQVSGSGTYQRATNNFVPRPSQVPPPADNRPSWSFTSSDYWSFGLEVSQSVVDYGSWRRLSAAGANAQAQAESERATLLAVVLNVRTAYFSVRANKALVNTAQETLTNWQRHLEQIQAYVEVGARPEIDLAQIRTDVANARVQLIQAENNYRAAKADLSAAMGVDGTTEFDVADETMPPVNGEEGALTLLLDEALSTRPEVLSLNEELRAQELTLSATSAGWIPTLRAVGGATDAGVKLNDLVVNLSAAAVLSWPIYQGGLVSAQTDEAHANLVGLQAQADSLRNQVRVEVDKARLTVAAAKASLTATEEAVTNARERLRLAEARYETGIGSAIELGDAQLTLTNAQAQQVQADYALATARAQLERALGRL